MKFEGTLSDIKGVIFDLGYTLIEYKQGMWPKVNDRGLRQAYRLLQERFSDLPMYYMFIEHYDNIKEIHRKKASETQAGWSIADVIINVLEDLEISPDEAVIDEFIEAIYTPARHIMYTQEGTAEVLNKLRDAGMTLGIISNTIYPASFHETDLEILGLGDCFDFAIYSSGFRHRKPHRDIFKEGIDQAGFPAEHLVYVGDRYDNDVIGAREAGMQAILKFCARQKDPNPLPDDLVAIKNLHELIGRLIPTKIK